MGRLKRGQPMFNLLLPPDGDAMEHGDRRGVASEWLQELEQLTPSAPGNVLNREQPTGFKFRPGLGEFALGKLTLQRESHQSGPTVTIDIQIQASIMPLKKIRGCQ